MSIIKGRDANLTVSSSSSSSILSASEAMSAITPPNITLGSSAGLDDITAMIEKVSFKRAENLINERLSAATQAHELTTKMLSDTTKMLGDANDMLERSGSLMSTITEGLITSSKMQERLEVDVANIKGSAVSALSIFVSFFAFITVSINVFSKADNVISAAALVLIFWSLLVGFNIVIGWQFNTLKNTGLAWFLLILVSFLSVFAVIGVFYFSPDVLMQKRSMMPTY